MKDFEDAKIMTSISESRAATRSRHILKSLQNTDGTTITCPAIPRRCYGQRLRSTLATVAKLQSSAGLGAQESAAGKLGIEQGSLDWDGQPASGADRSALERLARSTARLIKDRLRNGRLHALLARARRTWPPPVGWVDFGQLSNTRPISLNFGWDRGTPIDRYYIENFLADHARRHNGARSRDWGRHLQPALRLEGQQAGCAAHRPPPRQKRPYLET